MAARYYNNKAQQDVDVLVDTTETVVIAGNNTVSNIALPGEEITGAHIRQIVCMVANGAYFHVSRAGGEFIGAFDTTINMEYAGWGMPLNVAPTANLIVTYTGTAGDGSLYLKLRKESAT